MSYIEIKAIKAVAALHRGVVNTAICTLRLRSKAVINRFHRQHDYADDLLELAKETKAKATQIRYEANEQLGKSQAKIMAAEHTVYNLRDDLNKITG